MLNEWKFRGSSVCLRIINSIRRSLLLIRICSAMICVGIQFVFSKMFKRRKEEKVALPYNSDDNFSSWFCSQRCKHVLKFFADHLFLAFDDISTKKPQGEPDV